MNKYQEALNYINKSICTLLALRGIQDEQVIKNLHLLQEVVDKETPKKVIETSPYGTNRACKCPICNKRWSRHNCKKYKYCPSCGQRLNWGDKDE